MQGQGKTYLTILRDQIGMENRPGKKDIWLSMTINSQNYMTVEDLVEEWQDKVNKIGFQFHTPFVKGGPYGCLMGIKEMR